MNKWIKTHNFTYFCHCRLSLLLLFIIYLLIYYYYCLISEFSLVLKVLFLALRIVVFLFSAVSFPAFPVSRFLLPALLRAVCVVWGWRSCRLAKYPGGWMSAWMDRLAWPPRWTVSRSTRRVLCFKYCSSTRVRHRVLARRLQLKPAGSSSDHIHRVRPASSQLMLPQPRAWHPGVEISSTTRKRACGSCGTGKSIRGVMRGVMHGANGDSCSLDQRHQRLSQLKRRCSS